VVVVNWNGRQELEDCLRSLHESGFGDLRVIMVDNGSTDTSVDWTRKHYPRVEILESPQNLRWPAATTSPSSTLPGRAGLRITSSC